MKKLLSLILAFCLIFSFWVLAFAVDNSELTYLYLDKGNITIGDGTVSGYGYSGELITTPNENGYFITQNTTDVIKNTITFNGGKNYAVFSNLKVSISSQFSCCAYITNSADVTINIQDTNVLVSGASRAGIEVDVNSALTIEGTGKIMAGSNGQAGIGGGNGHSSGKITVNSGTVIAQNVTNSAGIGGGSTGDGGEITINGGNITAIGGDSGAGIGGGSTGDGGKITINGGTVTATGGANGAGIGGGWYGEMGEIIINGGSVKATAGSNASKIGAGAGAVSDSIYNAQGEVLSLVSVSTAEMSDIVEIYTDGKANNINTYHSNDTTFYFYLSKNTHIISADSQNSLTKFWKIENSVSTAITPISTQNGATISADDVVRGITCGASNLDDYLTALPEFSLSYSQNVIGTGTKINLIFDENVVFSYTALVYGDVNNDGLYDGQDSLIVLLMQWGSLNANNTPAYTLEAGDINRNGAIDQDDVETLQYAGLLLSEIPQNENGTVNTDSAQWEEYVSLVSQEPEENIDYEFNFITQFLKKIIEIIKSFVFSFIIY